MKKQPKPEPVKETRTRRTPKERETETWKRIADMVNKSLPNVQRIPGTITRGCELDISDIAEIIEAAYLEIIRPAPAELFGPKRGVAPGDTVRLRSGAESKYAEEFHGLEMTVKSLGNSCCANALMREPDLWSTSPRRTWRKRNDNKN